jgi:hypothetical protein
MKYIYLIFAFFLLMGCLSTKSHVKKSNFSPLNVTDPPPVVLDPLTDPSLSSQSHMPPFLIILISVLLICFVPYLYIKLHPYAINFLTKIRKKYKG